MSSYSSIYRLEHPEYREKERIKDIINNRKEPKDEREKIVKEEWFKHFLKRL